MVVCRGRRFLVDISPAILDRIRREPDAEAGWLALAAHVHDNGEYDLATIIRNHWDISRDSLRDGLTVAQAIDRWRALGARGLRQIAMRAREAEERGLTVDGSALGARAAAR
jgi:hypothetical protein